MSPNSQKGFSRFFESKSLERIILVGVGLKRESRAMESSLFELERLTETAGGEVAEKFYQLLERYHPATLIGHGKVLEIASACQRLKSSTVIFDHELTAAQQKNIESLCRAKILDRSRLILDIFAKRAQTREGKIQVELAQLSYLLPRLTGSWRGFSQQVGGIGTRGPGERQLEYEKRHIQLRIRHLKKDLEKVKLSRAVRRNRRLESGDKQIAIIGYTNAGKSTLLNSLSGSPKTVYADDKLFATLDPHSRKLRLPQGTPAVLTDTVGFIQRLPTALIAAFHSTLEEIPQADCLLIVSDATSTDIETQDQAVLKTLIQLNAAEAPQIKILNKADTLDFKSRAALRLRYPDRLLVSAQTGEGLDLLLNQIEKVVRDRKTTPDFDSPRLII